MMKEKYDHRLLLKHLPSDLRQFLDHIQSLEYAEKPDYAMLIGLFERCMKRRGVKESDPYDWEKVATDNLAPVSTTTSPSPALISRPTAGILAATRITDNLLEDNLMASLDNNQENIEPDNRKELEAQLDYEACRRRRRGQEYIQEPPANATTTPGTLLAAEAKLVVDRNCNASIVSLDKLHNEVDKSPKRRPTRRTTDDDQAARASTGDIEAEVVAVNLTGRPVSAPSGVPSNDNQPQQRGRAGRDETEQTTPELPSPRVREGGAEQDGSMYSYDVTRAGKHTTTGATAADTTGTAASGGSPIDPREPLKERPHRVRRFHSAGRSKHRGPGADTSITQFAMIDDDNVSQQVTRGGGGLTLASQWKSQFDDSEETDNEWKQEHLQSPEHRRGIPADSSMALMTDRSFRAPVSLSTAPPAVVPEVPVAIPAASVVPDPATVAPELSRISEDSRGHEKRSTESHQLEAVEGRLTVTTTGVSSTRRSRSPRSPPTPNKVPDRSKCLNIAGIEQFPELQSALPKAWSCPDLCPHIRPSLEAPLLQQAAFDEIVYQVDVMRNVASRRTIEEREAETKSKERRPSLPTMALSWPEKSESGGEEACAAVTGRLEVRVVPRPEQQQQVNDLQNSEAGRPRPRGILKSTSGTGLEVVNSLGTKEGSPPGQMSKARSPVSPGAGLTNLEDPSVYFDAMTQAEENGRANSLGPDSQRLSLERELQQDERPAALENGTSSRRVTLAPSPQRESTPELANAAPRAEESTAEAKARRSKIPVPVRSSPPRSSLCLPSDETESSSVRFSDEEQRLLASLLRRSATAPVVPRVEEEVLGGCTPALRRRRQGAD
ncbi:hypothetical protein B566_EDAN010294, partial [Ephemera danica]